MRHCARRATLVCTAILLALLHGGSICAAAEPTAEPTPAPKADATRAGKERRELPSEMILCRGPRGAVYARDAAEGCRYSRLTPENLVDFGAGSGCVLRRAEAPAKGEAGSEAETAKAATSCEDLCAAGSDGRACVVGLRKASAGGWETFSPAERFAAGDAPSSSAIAVCCGR